MAPGDVIRGSHRTNPLPFPRRRTEFQSISATGLLPRLRHQATFASTRSSSCFLFVSSTML